MAAGEVIELDHREAMRLLASVDHGRVVFTDQALPAIRVVNHLVDEGRVIVRTRLRATVSTVVRSNTDDGVWWPVKLMPSTPSGGRAGVWWSPGGRQRLPTPSKSPATNGCYTRGCT